MALEIRVIVGPFVGKTLLISDEPAPAQCLFLSTPTSFLQFLQPCNRRITVMASPGPFLQFVFARLEAASHIHMATSSAGSLRLAN